LHNIRAPQAPSRNNAGKAYGFECKEYLRKLIIGKPVQWTLVTERAFKKDDKEIKMQCIDIFIDEKKI
jgi:hypothetical protein